jgi:hypothetical protein
VATPVSKRMLEGVLLTDAYGCFWMEAGLLLVAGILSSHHNQCKERSIIILYRNYHVVVLRHLFQRHHADRSCYK